MKILALSSRKGGAGKSTLAVHLAVAAESRDLVTAIFDLDPQASATLWSDHRGEPAPAVVAAQAPRLRSLLQQAEAKGADLVILDTPPHADGVAADAGAASDAILIPCRPSAFDLDAIGASVRLAQAAKRPCWVVVNAAPVQGVEVAEMRAALEAGGVFVCPVTVHHRKAFSARAHEGRTAQEHEPGGKAATEIEALLTWMLDVLGLPGERGDRISGDLATEVESNPAPVVAEKPANAGPSKPTPKVTRGPATMVAGKLATVGAGNRHKTVVGKRADKVARP
jgi:chromosome partitioning protein